MFTFLKNYFVNLTILLLNFSEINYILIVVMRREKSTMKSILEEARAMRTASLSGHNKI